MQKRTSIENIGRLGASSCAAAPCARPRAVGPGVESGNGGSPAATPPAQLFAENKAYSEFNEAGMPAKENGEVCVCFVWDVVVCLGHVRHVCGVCVADTQERAEEAAKEFERSREGAQAAGRETGQKS